MNAKDLIKTGSNGSKKSVDFAALRAAAEDGSEKMSEDFRAFIDDVENMVQKSKSATGEELEEIKQALEHRVSEAKIMFDDQRGAMAERAKHAYSATSGYVRQHPVTTSTGVLAILGAVVGFLWWRQK